MSGGSSVKGLARCTHGISLAVFTAPWWYTAGESPRGLGIRPQVRSWHIADMQTALRMSALGVSGHDSDVPMSANDPKRA